MPHVNNIPPPPPPPLPPPLPPPPPPPPPPLSPPPPPPLPPPPHGTDGGVPYYITVTPLDSCNSSGEYVNIISFTRELSEHKCSLQAYNCHMTHT